MLRLTALSEWAEGERRMALWDWVLPSDAALTVEKKGDEDKRKGGGSGENQGMCCTTTVFIERENGSDEEEEEEEEVPLPAVACLLRLALWRTDKEHTAGLAAWPHHTRTDRKDFPGLCQTAANESTHTAKNVQMHVRCLRMLTHETLIRTFWKAAGGEVKWAVSLKKQEWYVYSQPESST